jgi:ubiquitin-activating enzyme E1
MYLKKEVILKEVGEWVEQAESTEALYTGLVMDHNHQIAQQFKTTKDQYSKDMKKLYKEL